MSKTGDGAKKEKGASKTTSLDITERKLAEEAIRTPLTKLEIENEQGAATKVGAEVQGLLNALPFYIILVDAEHHIVLANKAVSAALGVDPEHIIGGYCPKVVHGLDRPFPGCPLEEAVEKGHAIERDLFDPHSGRWMRSAVYPTTYQTQEGRTLFIHFVHDITERKQLEEKIQQSYQAQTILNKLLHLSLETGSLEEVLEHAIDHILSIPWIVFESRGAIFLVEDDPKVLVMKAQRRLSTPLLTACARVPFGRCLCGRAALSGKIEFADHLDDRHETRYEGITPHGHYCVPILLAGKVLGVINLYVREGHRYAQREEEFLTAIANTLAGVIERKRMEKELRETQEGLIRSERLAAIGQLAGGVGHELRNPLGAIKNATYYIKGKIAKNELAQKEPKVIEFINIMDDEINACVKIINDLLGFSRVGKPSVSPTQIKNVIEDALSRTTIPESIELIKKLDAELPQIEIDASQIQQVLVNMIINAVQAMPEGGKLIIGARGKEGFLEVRIADTGCGIPKEAIDKIFDPLFTTKAKGIGLGLAVCKTIIDRHEGKIEVKSQVGKGTTFIIKLPLNRR